MWPFLDFKCLARQIANIPNVFSKMTDILHRPSQKVKQQAVPKLESKVEVERIQKPLMNHNF